MIGNPGTATGPAEIGTSWWPVILQFLWYTMSRNSNWFLAALAACLFAGIYLFQITRGTGSLSIARAERLLDMKLFSEVNRIEVIAPDGQLAQALPSALRNIQAIDCPKLDSTNGTLPGRYGLGGRTYGLATFECLFTGESPSGATLFFSTFVHRSADPSVQGYTDGHIMVFLKSAPTRVLMRALHQVTQTHTQQDQADLWAELARDGIYVPADKTRKSPLEKAMEEHIRRLGSR